MAHYLEIHPDNPQPRFIGQAVAVLRKGGVLVYPTDSGYALGCHIGDKNALSAIRRIRGLSEKHPFTLLCRDLSEIAVYAIVDNASYRMIRAHTPGPYTFVLRATKEVPRRLMHPKRKTIGYRVPDNTIALALLQEMGEPVMNTSLILPGADGMMVEPYQIAEVLGRQVDLVLAGGFCGNVPTSVIDLTGDSPELIRVGAGSVEDFNPEEIC